MKRVLFFFCFFCLVSLYAVNVTNQPVEHIQPTGERVQLLLHGDEYYHYLSDSRGYTVQIDPQTDKAVYAIPRDGMLVPSDYAVGAADPSTLGLEPGLQPSRSEIRRIADSNGGNQATWDGHAPTTGTVNNIVIFVRFLDQEEYTEPLSRYETMLNSSTSASMRSYFLQESANQLTVNSHFYPAAVGGIVRSFQDGHPRGYFTPWTATNTIGYNTLLEGKQRMWLMMQYAISSVPSSVPFSLDLDADNDVEVDNVVFICKGAWDTRSGVLWPHHSTLWPYTPVYIGNLPVTDYNLQLSESSNIGTYAHEYSHTMGFPDLYHYDNTLNPVGPWDPMAAQSDTPQHHTTYMKHKYGCWFGTIPLITPTSTATQYTLTAIDQNPYSCYRIASTRPNEYYMLEYRSDTGTYESGVPGSGLIVYRILSSYGGSELWGNPNGPPDEVYVYRPGINANNQNGYIDLATYSQQSGRTEIYTGTDPSPWLYGDGTVELPGNLVIMDIGSTGTNSISFWIKNTAPNRWLGRAGTEWTEPLNWSYGTVPTVNDDVVVGDTDIYNPWIRGSSEVCKSLTIKTGGELIISSGNLEVADNLISYGHISVSSNESALYVYDSITLANGSVTDVLASGALISVEEDIRFSSGSTVNWEYGYLEFSGSSPSNIYCETAATICNLRIEKTGSGSCTISSSNTATLTLNGGIYVNSGILYHGYTGTTVLKGNLHAYSGGSLSFYNGTISCEGSSSATIRIDTTGSYLHKLRLAKTGSSGISLSTSYTFVGSDLSIVSGYLSCGSNTLYVGGNWTNFVGSSSFYAGSGRVVLNGLVNQSVSSETFNILELNKSGQLLVPSGSNIVCAVYDWTSGSINVSGGSFTAADLADDGIFGTYILSSGSIDFTQDSGQYIDLKSANISISGGSFTVRGGGGAMWMAYQGTTNFMMSSGFFDVRDQGIMISSAYPLNESITGGYIRTRGNFTVQRTDFNPSGGYVELWGNANANLFVAAGSYLSTLLVNKLSSRDTPESKPIRDEARIIPPIINTVYATGNLSIRNYLIVMNGCFDVSGYDISVVNDLQVIGQIKMSSGNLNIGDSVIWNGGAQVIGGTLAAEEIGHLELPALQCSPDPQC